MCVMCVVTDLGRAERPSQQQWVGVAPHDTPAFEQLIRRSPVVIAVFFNHYGKCWGTECRSYVMNNRQKRSLERPEVRRCCHELSTDHKGSDMRTVDCWNLSRALWVTHDPEKNSEIAQAVAEKIEFQKKNLAPPGGQTGSRCGHVTIRNESYEKVLYCVKTWWA